MSGVYFNPDDMPAASAISPTDSLALCQESDGCTAATPLALATMAQVASFVGSPTLQSLTSDYQVLPQDSGKQFDNYGATGAVVATLPAWQAGLSYSFAAVEDQDLSVQVGDDSVVTLLPENPVATSVAAGLQFSVITLKTSYQPGVWLVAAASGSWEGS